MSEEKKWATFSRLGNCYCVFYNNSPIILIGPHWLINAVSLIFITLAACGYIIFLFPKLEFYSSIIGTIIISISLITYLIISLIDPGVVFPDSKVNLYPYLMTDKLCHFCLIYKSNNIRHCDECNLCYKDLDHHCIFTGKCIARKNLICFYALLSSLFTFFVFSMFFVFTLNKPDR